MPRSVVTLPADVRSPFSVFVNGVPQHPGADYKVSGRELIFDRELARGRRLDVPAGAAVRFEPGEEKTVRLVPTATSAGFDGQMS